MPIGGEVAHIKRSLWGDSACCLGTQLFDLVEAVESLRPGLQWYVADLQPTGSLPRAAQGREPILVGSAVDLLIGTKEIDQFGSGVFVAVASSESFLRFREGMLWTDDDDDADIGNATIEIRAFDCSYWILATAEIGMVSMICDQIERKRES